MFSTVYNMTSVTKLRASHSLQEFYMHTPPKMLMATMERIEVFIVWQLLHFSLVFHTAPLGATIQAIL